MAGMPRPLPQSKAPTKLIELSGTQWAVRGLLRHEVHALRACGDDLQAIDVALVAGGCDVTHLEAAEWLSTASAVDAERLTDAVMELSGMGDAPKG